MNSGLWLTPPEPVPADRAQLTDYRLTWESGAQQESCPVRLSADCRYKLWCNGAFLNFGPAKGDDRVWYVDEIDLAPWLRPGRNVLAVQVLHYPADPARGNHSLFRGKRPGLWWEGPAGDWRCHVENGTEFYAEEERFAPLWLHERAAADPETQGWKTAAFDDRLWERPVPTPMEDLLPSQRPEKLLPRSIPFSRRSLHRFALPVQTVPAHTETEFVLDAGEEMCAFLRLALSGGRGAEIELLQSECYVTEQGKEDRLDAARGHLEGYADRYSVSGWENEVYEPFWFRTFRFIKVTVKTGAEPLRLLSLDYEETGYPLEVRTQVQTSNDSLSKIWDISLRTLRRCMHDTYMDCPFYEQLQYIMDTRSQILYTYAVSADDRLARQAIDDFSRAQRPDGLLNCSYPNVNVNVIPGFSIYYILILHDHMMTFGDRELIARYLPTVDRILDFFRRRMTAAGLVDKVGGVNGKAPFWSFIDWAVDWLPTEGMPTAGLHGPLTMESLLVILGLQKAAELHDYAGGAMGAEYRERARAMREAVRSQCMDERGMLTDGPGCRELSQHAQVFGVLTGTLSETEGRRNLLRTMEEPGVTQCTVAMCFYLFRALEQTGLYAYTDRYWDVWRRMLQNHCTTCVEAEGYARSECHAWGALALYELPGAVLGVRPAAPGYERILVRPCPGVLTSASGTVHTPRGDVAVSWEKRGGELSLHIEAEEAVKKLIITE